MAEYDNGNNVQDRELDWEDEIEKDSTFIVLPEGDYDFEVVAFERQRYSPKPDAKMPACNMAVLTIEIGGDMAKAKIFHRLFLHQRCEGILCAFFTAIGQRKKGEKLQMNWNKVVGSTGKCKVIVEQYNGNDQNRIARFYEPEDKPTTENGERTTTGRPYGGGWKPGAF